MLGLMGGPSHPNRNRLSNSIYVVGIQHMLDG